MSRGGEYSQPALEHGGLVAMKRPVVLRSGVAATAPLNDRGPATAALNASANPLLFPEPQESGGSGALSACAPPSMKTATESYTVPCSSSETRRVNGVETTAVPGHSTSSVLFTSMVAKQRRRGRRASSRTSWPSRCTATRWRARSAASRHATLRRSPALTLPAARAWRPVRARRTSPSDRSTTSSSSRRCRRRHRATRS